jgi:hypothetical protein
MMAPSLSPPDARNRLSGANAMLITFHAWPRKGAHSRPAIISHRMIASETYDVAARVRPSGENARAMVSRLGIFNGRSTPAVLTPSSGDTTPNSPGVRESFSVRDRHSAHGFSRLIVLRAWSPGDTAPNSPGVREPFSAPDRHSAHGFSHVTIVLRACARVAKNAASPRWRADALMPRRTSRQPGVNVTVAWPLV